MSATTEVANVEDGRSRDAANRELARDLIIVLANQGDLFAAKSDLGKVFHVEKVCAAQVFVAGRLSGPDLARVDRDLGGRFRRVFRIKHE